MSGSDGQTADMPADAVGVQLVIPLNIPVKPEQPRINRTKSEQLNIRMTPADVSAIKRAAAAAHMTVSDLIRVKVLGQPATGEF